MKQSFYLERCKFSLMKLNKEETQKIRDVTNSLYDVCKDFLNLFYSTIKCLQIATSRAS